MSASRVSLKRALLISETGKGIRWHENLPAGFQIQEGLLQTSVGIPWRSGNPSSTLQTFRTVDEKESWTPWVYGGVGGTGGSRSDWLVEICCNWLIWHFGVLTCCLAFTTGQREFRKMGVTVLFVLQSVSGHWKREPPSPQPASSGVTYRFAADVLCEGDFENVWL